jgi:phosphoribosylaminoimidazolecarboxamide formyltransferase/IMP cyclohydrolase
MSVNIVEKVDNLVPIKHALISVSDKSNLDLLVTGLIRTCPGIRIFSTGGTFARIQEILGDEMPRYLTQVSDYTGQPETQGGLVKTLDFKIYLGLLTETHNPAHQEDLKRTQAVPIDLVVVNLYPFKKTIEKKGVTLEKARANIDIGGPCMIRASAKNFHRVAVLVKSNMYRIFIKSLESNRGCSTIEQRFRLAGKAFQHTDIYDRYIAAYWRKVFSASVRDCYHIVDKEEKNG